MAEEEYNDDDVAPEDINSLREDMNQEDVRQRTTNEALNSSGGVKKDSNFLHIQISNSEMLEKLEHFYRGDTWGKDGEGNYGWIAPTNNDLVTFNDFGVSTMMDIVTKYIDKNTTLSYYNEDRINEIMGDLGDELILLILSNYKQMGMDSYFKKTKFRIVIVTTIHMIESAYRRALRGKTMEELNQSRVVGQFGNLGRENQPQAIPRQSRIGGFFQHR
ncbi:hypothetical protein LCGC14_1936940 [marine sediment metagenome]|uniref:Uncharacterized protein n=1 Tax=marine sediment metagenome TaxID=412755 RepID=A0A0F9G9W4_9ZZZZ